MDREILGHIGKWFSRGEYGRVVYTCDSLLNNPQYRPLRAELLYWKGSAHELAGRAWYGEALSCFREGFALSGRNPAMRARFIAALGQIYSQMGDCTAYDRLMKEFERLARDHSAKVMSIAVYIWFNYGVTLENAFRWREASKAYSTAAQMATELEITDMLGKSLHNLSGIHLALGQLPEAAAIMAQAECLLDDDVAGHKKMSRRAEYFLAAGDLVSAQQMITSALVHPLVDNMTRADIYYTWAQTLRALGRVSEAQEKALLGLDNAVRAVHYPGIHKLNRLLQQVSDQSPGSKERVCFTSNLEEEVK